MVGDKHPVRRETDEAGLRARGIYLLPNLFTSAALFAGFYANKAADVNKLGNK